MRLCFWIPLLLLLNITNLPTLRAQAHSPTYHLGDLAATPDWASLEPFQHSIYEHEFRYLLDQIYARDGAWKASINVDESGVTIRTAKSNQPPLRIAFANSLHPPAHIKRYWRPAWSLPPTSPEQPLENLHIALDPGHLGGKWAKMEARWYSMGDDLPVKEGEMTLTTAKILKEELESLGAKVTLVRYAHEPATRKGVEDFMEDAREIKKSQGITDAEETYEDPTDYERVHTIQFLAEKLFYRTHEIRSRGIKVNEIIKPDLCLCLHYNAAAWGDPAKPSFVDANHLHVLVSGTYSIGELAYDDQRYEMMRRLFERTYWEEIAVAEAVVTGMAKHTKLPPYIYRGNYSKATTDSPYIYARNLLANRVFQCPVVYLEPYVMNHESIYQRVQLGDYEGTQEVNGEQLPSIYREYVAGVVEGLRNYYLAHRPLIQDN